jgi:hypothetical protein
MGRLEIGFFYSLVRHRMSAPPQFASSTWFVTLVALFIALGAQTLIGAIVPLSAIEWLYEKPPIDQVVLIAGETSFWRVDTLIRAVSFALGAFIACLLARSHSWQLLASLVAISLVATVFAQFPRPAAPWQLGVWATAAPLGALLAAVPFRVWTANA